MQIKARYSHLNGEEYLLVHHKELWKEVLNVIAGVDALAYKTKVSEEKTKQGELLFSPKDINQAFKDQFGERGWFQRRTNTFWMTHDDKLMRHIHSLPANQQKQAIEAAGYVPIDSYNQTDFVKDRIAVEVQLGKYTFVAHDLFVKHVSFYASDIIDVGIEILPMKEMARGMSSSVAYYERDLLNVLRQGRGVPAVPLVLIGVAP